MVEGVSIKYKGMQRLNVWGRENAFGSFAVSNNASKEIGFWGDAMKLSITCAIAMLAISSLSCATERGEVRNCPVLEISYVGSAPNERGNPVGIFSITNRGDVAVDLLLEDGAGDLIHGRYASTEQRSSSSNSWKAFNPLLDEMLAPKVHMTVMPGQRDKFRFDANGLFVEAPQVAGMECSIVVKDEAGCTFRSAPFQP